MATRVAAGMAEAAQQFISPAKEAAPAGAFHIEIDKKPARTRRVGFVMTEDDYSALKEYCAAHGVSVSEFINQATKWVMSNG